MKNSVYILSFDRDNIVDVKKFHKAVTANPLVKNWSHYIKSSYILVASTKNASTLSRSLDSALKDIQYFLMEVNPANCNGFLPQRAWDWIDKVVNNAEGGISFDSFLGVSTYRVNSIIKTAQSFKIGKTGSSLADRRNQQDYRDVYPNIRALFTSRNKDLVSIAEAELINTFIDNPKCNNIKGGEESENDTMADSNKYSVYIVWK